MKDNKKKIYIMRHTVYSVMLLLLYVLQSTPGPFNVGGAAPLWVIPAAVCVAMFEGEFVGGIYGAAAGLLCDAAAVPRQSGGTVVFGMSGFLLCVLCVVVGLLIIYLLRCNLLGCMLFVATITIALGSLEFLFAYGMWGHENGWKIYVYHTLPVIAWTLAVTPLLFFAIRWIHNRFEAALQK
jgi:cell shape-determining protein MreD